MVADFSAFAMAKGWTVYAEWGGWDLVLARPTDGFQIGVEAKLALNAKVLCQVLAHDRYGDRAGPDCHAVLAPKPKAVNGLETIAKRLGITVILGSEPSRHAYPRSDGPRFEPGLPGLGDHLAYWRDDWPQRCPDRRIALPDYVPDVIGGHSAPVKLTPWKIAALKAAILMEERGRITRADFKALGLSPSRWTQFWLCSDGDGGWLPTKAVPDFRAQHPVNYEQIKADFEKWAPPAQPMQGKLGEVAA